MYYYIYRNSGGEITAYDQTSYPKPPPAISVSKEEFQELGFYRPEPAYTPSVDPGPEPDPQPTMSDLTEAVSEGVNSV